MLKKHEELAKHVIKQFHIWYFHPAIISVEQFEQVIQGIKRRFNVLYDEYGKAHRKDSKYSSKVKDH